MKAHRRTSSFQRTLESSDFGTQATARHWMPAFAGMTTFRHAHEGGYPGIPMKTDIPPCP
ncbi:hypothetical protein [Rhodanobacter sp. PCA2]|uniref:hypothetical protein n=1 Tax=Rhodanobacter sp. PCA2 TaxID=2006117 RepID=UPI0015E64F90|nr:hypothetical protein [Rhodanobacter sp. PCA2]